MIHLDKMLQGGDDSELEALRAKAAKGDKEAAEALKDIEGIFSFLNSDDSEDEFEEANPYDELCGEDYEDFEALCDAAKHGDETAMDMQAAIFYHMGDIDQAVDCAMNFGMKGSLEPLKNLATQLVAGDGYNDPELACNLFRAGAQMGDGYCAYNAAICIHKGIGCEKNPEQALELFTQAALFGFEEAYSKIELVCKETMGDAGEEEYIKRLKELASHLYPGANMALYKHYIKEGAEQDVDKALACLFRACEGGSRLAAFELAKIVKEGAYGFISNPGRAMAILQSLSDDSPEACYELAKTYKESDEKDAAENAFKYMKKAFDMGCLDSVKPLAEFYEKGYGCAKNPAQAAMLMSLIEG